jgi:hypothetical protein
VVHLDEIPLLGIGKPDRAALRDRAAQVARGREPVGREPVGTVATGTVTVGGGGER